MFVYFMFSPFKLPPSGKWTATLAAPIIGKLSRKPLFNRGRGPAVLAFKRLLPVSVAPAVSALKSLCVLVMGKAGRNQGSTLQLKKFWNRLR